MECKNCGRSLESGMNFCPGCGISIRKAIECPICKKMINNDDKCCGYLEEVLIDTVQTDVDTDIKTVSSSIEMVLVEGGSFMMGSDDGGSGEKPVHRVTLDTFFIGKYPVTFSEYDEYCEETGREKPSDNDWGRGARPAINVSWYDAVCYCNWLSKKHGLKPCYSVDGEIDLDGYDDDDLEDEEIDCDFQADGYRLPTEAEWEYAARGGKKSRGYKYSGSNDLDEVAWYDDNSDRMTHPVGKKRPNELGIYDMSGNVDEWCWDWYDYDYYSVSAANNPKGPANSEYAVLRGGSWYVFDVSCRVAYRYRSGRSRSYDPDGFRVSRTYD